MKRRYFLKSSATAGVMALAGAQASGLTSVSAASPVEPSAPLATIKPRRLKPGDTVGLVAPATAVFQDVEQDIARESLEALALKVNIGQHKPDRHG